jgi:nucleoside-diphosphate-sugar epimerase
VRAGKKRTFLVTGGSGLLGSRLVRRVLEEGHEVRVLDIRYGELDDLKNNPDLEFVGIGTGDQKGGMLDKRVVSEATRNISAIYHLAVNWNGHSWTHRLPLAEAFDANIRGTLNLLEAARSRSIEHFLFSSSAAVYGETQRTIASRNRSLLNKVVDEESACRPYLWEGDPGPAYAVLKLELENLCLMHYHLYRLPVTIFRIEYCFVDQQQVRDGANIHVDDAVKAFLLATLDKRAYGQIFNVGYQTQYMSTRKIQRVLNWKPEATRTFLRSIRE